MPQWMDWLHMPKFTDEKYAAQKKKHIDQYGYTVTVPGWDDIIHINTPPRMDMIELEHYNKKDWDFFDPKRLEELKAMKQKKFERYEAMLGSPTPAIVSNFGSVMCAIDDAQDAVATMACIGSVARATAPKILGKVLAGPVGVLWTVADFLNLIQSAPQACLGWKDTKKRYEKMSQASPKGVKAKIKYKNRMALKMPRYTDWIQALQTTDQVFGFGISLGPLVGLITDLASAGVRQKLGQKVNFAFPSWKVPGFARTVYRHVKTAGAALTYPIMSDDTDTLTMFSASLLAHQYLVNDYDNANALIYVDNIQGMLIRAPIPEDPLTLEIIKESGVPLKDACGWPQTGELWSSIEDLADATRHGVTDNVKKFVQRNKHSFMGYWGASAVTDAAMYQLASLVGDGMVDYDYSAAAKICNKLLANSTYLDPAQGAKKLRDFAGFMDQMEKSGDNPTMEEIKKFCQGPAQIKLKEC